jgi:hypothetical protein
MISKSSAFEIHPTPQVRSNSILVEQLPNNFTERRKEAPGLYPDVGILTIVGSCCYLDALIGTNLWTLQACLVWQAVNS